MGTLSTKIFAALILLSQVWCGLAGGRTVCVSLPMCAEHRAAAEHEEPAGTAAPRCEGHSHAHGPVAPVSHEHEDCGCHLHLPVPDDQPLPRTQIRSEIPDLRCFCVPVPMAIVDCDVEPCPVVPHPGHPPDQRGRAQVRALKATRLLI